MEKEMNKENYITSLQSGVRTITFTKKDGTERIMKATLQEGVIPVTTKSPTERPNLVVFDTEKQGWRSIVITSIKTFT
jgi:hypothetical protein